MHTYSVLDYWFNEHGTMFDVTELGAILKKLPPLKPGGPWIAGGAVRRAAMGEKLGKDIDIFFASEEQFEGFRSHMHALACGCELVPEETKRRVMFNIGRDKPKLDLVRGTYFSNPKEMLADFDFTCFCFATDGSSLWVGEYALLHAALKQIHVNNIDKIGASLDHMERYLREGFTADRRCLDELLRHGREGRNRAKIDYSGPHNIPVQE